jgi:hypothetical protein
MAHSYEFIKEHVEVILVYQTTLLYGSPGLFPNAPVGIFNEICCLFECIFLSLIIYTHCTRNGLIFCWVT